MNERGHSIAVTNEEEGKEVRLPSRLCFLTHASVIAVVQLGTNWQQHPPNLRRAPLPRIPSIVTWNATISFAPFLLRWSDRGSCRLGGAHRCSEGTTTNNSKIDMIPWQKYAFHVPGAAVPVVTADVGNRDVSRRTFSWLINRPLVPLSPPCWERLWLVLRGCCRPLAPAGRPPSSLFNQSHVFLPSHSSHRRDFAATEMTKAEHPKGVFPGFYWE